MIYSTPEFIIFFLLVFTTYLTFNRFYKPKFAILLASSLFFYAWSGTFYFALFILIISITWLAMLFAEIFPEKRKPIITAGVVVLVADLFFWKYLPWVVSSIQKFFPNFLNGNIAYFPLPIGISFYTLQGVSFLLDFYRGTCAKPGFMKFLLFKSFFPQLVAGPIVREHELMPQISQGRFSRIDTTTEGVTLFLQGFFKKIVIADAAAIFVDRVFSSPLDFDRPTLIAAILAYTVQIWGDFSGYTDMGRGIALVFGYRLPENFKSPYLANGFSDFWRRWHITLSEWIRDYIYIPLGGSRKKGSKSFIIVLLTMMISGIWHGASFTFVIWGAYHGILLIIERLIKKLKISSPNFIGISLTFLMTNIGWLIFRSQQLGTLKNYLTSLLLGSGTTHLSSTLVLYCLMMCFIVQICEERKLVHKANVFWERLNPIVTFTTFAAIFLLIIIFRGGTGNAKFIYFQF